MCKEYRHYTCSVFSLISLDKSILHCVADLCDDSKYTMLVQKLNNVLVTEFVECNNNLMKIIE